ncbi:hypothetical protein ACFE04_005144 [Oxalis oulophora]
MVKGIASTNEDMMYWENCSDSFYDHQDHHHFTHEAADFIINQTPKHTRQQEELASNLLKLAPLGLSLDNSPSFVDFIEDKLINRKRATSAERLQDYQRQQAEKLKASSFPAKSLIIGNWKRESRHESDLIAKCYFAKRRLVWELLEGGLKKKIELQWSDISAIQAVIKENEPGLLKIEISTPPTFYEETNPQPRKHTNWQPTADFTGGQASMSRRHYIWFAPGILDSRFEKLMQCDDRLLRLSQQPFPSQPSSPYFQTDIYGIPEYSINFDGNYPGFTITNISPPVIHSPNLRTSNQTTIQSPVLKDSPSPVSVMNFPNIDARSSSDIANGTWPPFWSQGTNQFADTSVRDHQSNFAENLSLNYNTQNYGEINTRYSNNSADQDLNEHQQSLPHEENNVKRVTSFSSLISMSVPENPESNFSARRRLDYGNQQRPAHYNCELLDYNTQCLNDGYMQQGISQGAPQNLNFYPENHTPIHNVSMHPSMFLDRGFQDSNKNSNDGIYSWNIQE